MATEAIQLTNRQLPEADDDFVYITPKEKDSMLRNPSGSAKAGAFNLVCSVLVRGMLALPFAFSLSGIFLGGLMLIFVAFLAYVACTLSIATMQAVLDQGWAHKRSLFAVSFKLFGRPGAMLVRFSMLNFLLGTIAGFIVYLDTLLSPVLDDAKIDFPIQVVQLFAVLFIIFPLCLLQRFRSLSLTSTLSALVYAYLIIVVAIRYAVTELRHNISRGLQGVLNKFPVMTLAFCVRTLFWSDFFDRSRTRTNANLSIIWVVLFLVASFGYLAFFENTSSSSASGDGNSTLFTWSSDPLLFIGKLALCCVICLSIPLLIYPIRAELDIAIFRNKQPTPIWRRAMFSFILLAVAYTIAVAFGNATAVFSITSALAGSLIIFVFPGLFFLKMDAILHVSNLHAQRPLFWLFKGNWSDLRRIVAIALVIVGLFFTIISIWACVYSE